jgi:predicted transcriptional regulator
MPMSPHELNLIERFIAAYNALDSFLQSTLGAGSHQSFRSLVDAYAKRHSWWGDAEALRAFANLRNILVHERTTPYEYICAPSLATVERIETIRDRLLHPEKALPRFERHVQTLRPDEPLNRALKLIRQHSFSQFPVYDGARFCGVLTENSITRWLAVAVQNNGQNLELDAVTVREVLRYGGKRPNFQFVARDTNVEAITFVFHQNTWLEAVLVTEHGHQNERLLGIVTRGDIWKIEGENQSTL